MGEELLQITSKYTSIDKSIKTIIEEVIDDIELRETIVMYNPHSDKKDKILSFLQKSNSEEQKENLRGFEPTIDMLKKYFALKYFLYAMAWFFRISKNRLFIGISGIFGSNY